MDEGGACFVLRLPMTEANDASRAAVDAAMATAGL